MMKDLFSHCRFLLTFFTPKIILLEVFLRFIAKSRLFYPYFHLIYFSVGMTIFASALGLIYSLFLMIFKGKKGGDAIPFGPFLSAGALINLYYLVLPEMLTIQF